MYQMSTELKDWFMKQFLDWQTREGEKRTVKAFAEYLDVSRGTLNNWMLGGREPKGYNVNNLANKLSPEIYDILGLARPNEDPELQKLHAKWSNLRPETRDKIMRIIAEDEELGRFRKESNPTLEEKNEVKISGEEDTRPGQ
jgi:transcriptional regulator with XRE-family HTH domain